MNEEKKYFKSIDDTFCSSLDNFINEAKNDGLKEITLVEAIPDNNNTEFVWCSHYGECIELHLCKKSECSKYTSKSGRGKCSNKGKLFSHGEEVTFKIND